MCTINTCSKCLQITLKNNDNEVVFFRKISTMKKNAFFKSVFIRVRKCHRYKINCTLQHTPIQTPEKGKDPKEHSSWLYSQ